MNDGSGKTPGGDPDWYEKSRVRDHPQPQEGKYQEYLLPRITVIPRGSRLTAERLKSLDVGDWLWPEEHRLFEEMMINREGAIAFEWSECGKIHEDVSPDIVIKTVPHEAWQEKNFPCPKALIPTVTKMLLERMDRGVLEKCDGPYRNPWFLVAKKQPGTYRLINAAMKMNSYTMRDANMPPSVDEFSEEFAGCQIASLIDFFSGYDQLRLDPKSRDLTAFMTPLGLLRMTTPPQGATNSVAQFVRVVMTILQDLFPGIAMPFLDDIGVKGPYTDYNNEEVLPGIRRFVFEHIQNLDKTLERCERAGACIGSKSQFCHKKMGIVGYVCGAEGREPAASKVEKIVEWNQCDNVSHVKAFLGICVYYRIWIEGFARIAEPLYRLCKKEEPWVWQEEQIRAMDLLKEKLVSPPLLCKLHYFGESGWGEIILAVDASLLGWGGTLGQIDDKGRRRVARYESGLWNSAERGYDATKRECRGILKCLQKVRFWLYGVHFILETDTKTLVAQLNRAATDLPGALVTRWLAWIRLFDFEVCHTKGKIHTAPDGLSRKPRTASDIRDMENDMDVDDFIAGELDSIGARSLDKCARTSRDGRAVPKTKEVEEGNDVIKFQWNLLSHQATEPHGGDDNPTFHIDFLDPEYSERYQNMARYLKTLDKPEGMSRTEVRRLIRDSSNYAVRGRKLWINASKSYPSRLVIDDKEDKAIILRKLHNDVGHTGRETTYHRIANRYFWEGCWIDVDKYIRSCAACQHRSKQRLEETLYPQRAIPLFRRIVLDVVYLPHDSGYDCLVVARDNFSGWPEAKAMKGPINSKKVAKFVMEEVVCRHGVFDEIVVDGGRENMGDVIKEMNKYDVRRRVISAYNSKANGAAERTHQLFLNALTALTNGGKKRWIPFVPWVLLAIRTTVHGPTGCTPFWTIYGREAVLPVETLYPTWRVLDWDKVNNMDKLIEMRARQLQMRDEDIEESRLRKERMRKMGQAHWDATRRLRNTPIEKGDLVLTYDVKQIDQDKSKDTKLLYSWLGPFRVVKAVQEKGYYNLEELDGTPIRRSYAGNRIKKFIKSNNYWWAGDDSYPNKRNVDDNDAKGKSYTLETEAEEFERNEGTQEIQKDTGIVVRVPHLTKEQRKLYIQYSDPSDTDDTSEMDSEHDSGQEYESNKGSPTGYNMRQRS